MKTKNIILYIVICLIIIAGLAVWNAKGFNTELQYSSRKQMQLGNYTGIDISDVQSMCSDVLGNTRFYIQKVEIFENAVSIVADDITDEQKGQIIDKFNEKYGTDIEKDSVNIESTSPIRVKDVLKKYIVLGVGTLLLVLVYFIIKYRKIGWKAVILKTLLTPIVLELIMFSIIAITRIPLGKVAIAVGTGLYIITIFILTVMFENQKDKFIENEAQENA